MANAQKGTFVTFFLAGEEHACDVFDVIEVTPALEVTVLPGSAPAIAGVVTWRGRTVPVVDLTFAPTKRASREGQRHPMLLLRGPEPFALRIERAGEILHAGNISGTAPPGEAEARGVVALLRTARGIVPVLDPTRVATAAGHISPDKSGPHLEENHE